MIQALAKSLAQLDDRRLRVVVWRAFGVSLAVFAALWALAWWTLSWLGGGLAERLAEGGLWARVVEWGVSLGGLAAVLVVSFLLFPGMIAAAQSLFLDDTAEAVEARHYPDLPATPGQPLREGVRDALVLAGVTLAVNLLALPAYLISSFVPPLNLFVFYALNGYLLGREYFEMVAARRMTRHDAKSLRRQYRSRVMAAGVAIAVMLTVPLVNLLAPVVATAFMVHVFERARRDAGAGALRPA